MSDDASGVVNVIVTALDVVPGTDGGGGVGGGGGEGEADGGGEGEADGGGDGDADGGGGDGAHVTFSGPE